ncbi:nucleotidyltransferase family protein [Roseomonas sp. AR75]|uniref:nucleotidyltransferase family protein n=1 Tax=Roseomonas sp. AR75 TaxID=2562311 RepID=UPI0010BF8573|nr:nucleotidyltransferase family protein [Roseomonas sp. AR75]
MSAAQVAAILAGSAQHADALQAAALAGPAGGWIGAGFLRNAVWDALSGRAPDIAALADLDLVHHDPSAPPDACFEAALRAARALPWSVVNQARAHPWNGHAPYRDLADALAHWPETATAVAARLARGRIEILAPHGLHDLMAMVVRPTPAHAADPRAVRDRLAAKGWPARWPRLRVIGLDGH